VESNVTETDANQKGADPCFDDHAQIRNLKEDLNAYIVRASGLLPKAAVACDGRPLLSTEGALAAVYRPNFARFETNTHIESP
jgi:hypothetical protein